MAAIACGCLASSKLRYLVAVADTLSFSRAADQCRVTQPTLSMQLKELEGRLNTQLVERTRARVVLTPVGAEIARRARFILAEIEDIREIARRDDPDALQGTLQMGVLQTIGGYVLSLAMPALREAFPQLRIVVRRIGWSICRADCPTAPMTCCCYPCAEPARFQLCAVDPGAVAPGHAPRASARRP